MKLHLPTSTLAAILSAICSSLLITSPVYATALIDPTTEPAATAAPYALSNTDLSSGTETAYRPWFENSAWQGDLVQYQISSTGTLSTSIILSTTPPTNDDTITPTNWSARMQFDAAVTANSNYCEQSKFKSLENCTGTN